MSDQTYQKTIPGTKNAVAISRLIHLEEMDALSSFQKSQLAAIEGKIANLITFEHTDDGSVPNECSVIPNGKTVPDEATKEWSGSMVVSGQTQSVDLYRLNS